MSAPVTASPLTSRQRSIVLTAWASYALYYLGRVNISSALPSLETDLGLSKAQSGWFLTGFFLVYAFSTLLNGYLGDRLSPRWFVFTGLVATALLNLLFGLSSAWLVLLVLWCFNGYFQSTGWGPILRTLDNSLSTTQKARVSSLFGSSFVAGSALTWLLVGWCAAQFGWRWAFFMPSAVLLAAAVLWVLVIPNQASPVQSSPVSFFPGSSESVRRYGSLGVCALFVGLVFGVVSLWSPTYFIEAGSLGVGVGSSVAALLPVAGIVGISLTAWVIQRYFIRREKAVLNLVLLVLGLLCLAYSILPFSLGLAIVGTALIAAFAYSATTLVLSTLPLLYARQGETSGTAGLIDFFFAIGTSLSGVTVGNLLTYFGWSSVFLGLAATSVLALVAISMSKHPA